MAQEDPLTISTLSEIAEAEAAQAEAAPSNNVRVKTEKTRRVNIYPLRVCPKCNALRLERCSRKGLWQLMLSLFCLFPYKCRGCFQRQFCFIPSAALLRAFWICILVCWTGLLAWRTVQMANHPASAVATGNFSDPAYASRAASGNLTSFERMMLARKRQVMRNEDIVKLVKAGVNPALMITMLRNSDAAFDLSPQGVVILKQSGVEDLIISTMFERSTQLALSAAQ